jgi:hypothetical protein
MASGESRTFTLGYLPDSYNVTKGAHWAKAGRSKQNLQHDMELMLMGQRMPRPLPGPVAAFATLVVPVKRRRDEGNFRTPLEKALGDALVNGGWLADDTPDLFRFGAVTFDHQPVKSETRITVAWRTDMGAAAA